MQARGFGWRPDKPDFRDKWFHNYKIVPGALTPRQDRIVDLRHLCPPVWDQGDLGSCTAQAIAGVLQYNRIQDNLESFTPSRLFIYYNERKMEGSIMSDAGAELRDGIKSVAVDGYPHENLWPYDISRFSETPPEAVYQDAVKHKALTYYRLDNTKLNVLRTCLDGNETFVFGSMIYKSFYEADSNGGMVPMPNDDDEGLGGHAMMCVGYDDFREVFIIRNSWGDRIGDKGYYYMPYRYLCNHNLSDDFWTIKTVQ
jgi:C1A family cysteine protease